MMQISHEVPVDILPVSRTFNDYDYALVHLFEKIPKYRDFYYESVESGRKVLLDNSIFELKTAFDPEKFAYWVNDLKPAEYVVPDVLGSSEDTLNSLEEFRSKYPIRGGKEIVVVQGATWKDMNNCMATYCKDPLVKKIAIPFQPAPFQEYNSVSSALVSQFLIDPIWMIKGDQWACMALNRLAFVGLHSQQITENHKEVHLLGCSVPWEFSLYKKMGWDKIIQSIDTSNPIVAAILEQSYDPEYGVLDKWDCILADFIKHKLNKKQLLLAWKNTNLFRKLLS